MLFLQHFHNNFEVTDYYLLLLVGNMYIYIYIYSRFKLKLITTLPIGFVVKVL